MYIDTRVSVQRRYDMNRRFQSREVKTGFCPKRLKQTGSSGTLIGWKSGQTTFVTLKGPKGWSVAMDSVGYNDFDF
jgi:hypothetical protein